MERGKGLVNEQSTRVAAAVQAGREAYRSGTAVETPEPEHGDQRDLKRWSISAEDKFREAIALSPAEPIPPAGGPVNTWFQNRAVPESCNSEAEREYRKLFLSRW